VPRSYQSSQCDFCVAMCCSVFSVLQCVAVCCSVSAQNLPIPSTRHLCCNVLQCVAVCCSVLQCVAVCCSVLQSVGAQIILILPNATPVLQCVAVCCNVLQCAAVCCSVLQCVAVRCSALQCAVACCSVNFKIVNGSWPTGPSCAPRMPIKKSPVYPQRSSVWPQNRGKNGS